jgi:hypothetical protein
MISMPIFGRPVTVKHSDVSFVCEVAANGSFGPGW